MHDQFRCLRKSELNGDDTAPDRNVSLSFLGAIRGHQGFRSFLFSTLEGQGAPKNSFVSIQLVVSNPIGSTNFLIGGHLQRTFGGNKGAV